MGHSVELIDAEPENLKDLGVGHGHERLVLDDEDADSGH